MTDLDRACPVSSIVTDDVPGPKDALFVGTSGLACGSNPGAILRNASLLRRSFSSSRARKYASRRVACAMRVDRRDSSRRMTCGSRVKGYTNWDMQMVELQTCMA